MPLHLTPLTRREFLRGAALAGAGLMMPRALFAAENADDSHWALLSDPHIAGNADLVFRDVHLADHLRAAVQAVAALTERPAGVFVNGDCALKDGQAQDYATFTSLLKPLTDAGLPLHMTLGNHDDREHFWTALMPEKNARPLQSKHVSLVEGSHANWVLLDSLDKTNSTPGLLDKEQREWLGKTLDEHADKPTIVMVHHNPDFNAATTSGLVDSTELFEVLVPRQHVKAVIFGHTHRWEFKEKDGIHLINLPAVAYPFAKEQPTGWTDCHLAAGGATFELRAHDDKHPWHGEKKELKWRV